MTQKIKVTGKLTAVGVDVRKDGSTMYLVINGRRHDIGDKTITIEY